jgi:phosphoribosylformimino-5-aminoimidazole carboxamide ribotide isomerase
MSALQVSDPVGAVRSFVHDGFERIHLMDLDALDGGAGIQSSTLELLRDGAAEFDVTAGVKSITDAQTLFDAGATRLVVGSRALEEPDWLLSLADLFPGVVVLASQVRERQVVTRGWLRTLPTDLLDLVAELRGVPLGALLVSSMNLDGERRALDLALLEDVAEASSVPVLAAGPFESAADLRTLEHRGIAGAVIGAGLYTGELDPRLIAQEFSA